MQPAMGTPCSLVHFSSPKTSDDDRMAGRMSGVKIKTWLVSVLCIAFGFFDEECMVRFTIKHMGQNDTRNTNVGIIVASTLMLM